MTCFATFLLAAVLGLPIGELYQSDRSPMSPSGSSCLRGRVAPMDGRDAARVPVNLSLSGNTFLEQRTTELFGSFAFCRLPPGELALEASAPGFQTSRMVWRDRSDPGMDSFLTIALDRIRSHVVPASSKTVSAKSLAVPKSARNEMERFIRHAGKGNWADALASLERAAAEYPDYVEAWVNLGAVYMRLSRPLDAEQAYKRALEIDEDTVVARKNLGLLYLKQNRLNLAMNELEAAARQNPSDPQILLFLSQCLSRKGDVAGAEKLLRRALEIRPEMPPALYELGMIEIQSNRRQEAIGHFELFLQQEGEGRRSAEIRRILASLRANPE